MTRGNSPECLNGSTESGDVGGSVDRKEEKAIKSSKDMQIITGQAPSGPHVCPRVDVHVCVCVKASEIKGQRSALCECVCAGV